MGFRFEGLSPLYQSFSHLRYSQKLLLTPRTLLPSQTHFYSTSQTTINSSQILIKPTSNRDILRHLSSLLCRHGSRGEPIVVDVQQKLQLRYGVPNPIQQAIDAVKPVIKYYKSKGRKAFVPLTLFPRTAESMAMRWVIEAAEGRTYKGNPDIRKGLVDEFDAIIQGTSSLYLKRYNTHRNPN